MLGSDMRFLNRTITNALVFAWAFGFALANRADAQGPTVAQALKIQPRQSNVDYDTPAADEIEKCRIEKSADRFDIPGYVVYDSTGRILRLFLDENRDGNLDRWSYFQNGIEVYRDIDSNHDKRTDQYRWMGNAGTRWGLDADQDGEIDEWKMISAEEVAEEAFWAIRENDADRFRRLLLDSEGLAALELGETFQRKVAESIREASVKFATMAREQKPINSKTNFVHFGSSRPGLVPAGYQGLKRDVVIYDHASAVFENGGEYGQISLGTVVRNGDKWALIELPQIIAESSVVSNGGFFYSDGFSSDVASSDANNGAMTRLFEEFEEVEKALATAEADSEVQTLEQKRAEILASLVENSSGEDRENWFQQLTDTVTGAYQNGRLENGLDLMRTFLTGFRKKGIDVDTSYAQWRVLNAEFSLAIQTGTNREREEANEKYFDALKQFAEKYPRSQFTADALLQLALYSEVRGGSSIDEAVKWYRELADRFKDSPAGKRAQGAITRLTAKGKPIAFEGQDFEGRRLNLDRLQGKIVVIHYWETWCDTCIDSFDELKQLASKYRSDVVIIGANLDDDKEAALKVIKSKGVTWPQLHASGGVDSSPLAIQMGVNTLPMTLLIDQQGHLVDSTFLVEDLDREIQRLLRDAEKSADKSDSKRRR